MTAGPTRGAEDTTAAWASRPVLAAGVKALVVLLPLAAGTLLATFVGSSLWRSRGWLGAAVWLVQLAVVSTATIVVVDRFARRLLPLAGLLNLSLVFPDEAPSRFGVALKAGTTKRLRAELEERPADETVNESATRLLSMVTELNSHDRLTRGHTERVRAYSDLIAEEMGLEGEDRWKLRWAVLLHDIGKLTVPPHILNKAGRPTNEEWDVLRGHPAAGALMVEPLAEWLGEWRLATGQHHERWDGGGYPNGLAGEQISLAGRIVAVADAYDVITSARSYKQPMAPEVARQELVRCAGSQFDPQVVAAFVRVSLGRLRLVGGPLATLASMPIIGNLPGAVAAVAGNAAVAASVAAATAVGGVATLPSPPGTSAVTPAAVVAPAPPRRSTPVGATTIVPQTPASPGRVASTSATTASTAPAVTVQASPTVRPGGSSSTLPSAPVVPTTVRPSTTTSPPSPLTTTTRPISTTTRPITTTTTSAPVPIGAADHFTAARGDQTTLAVLANDAGGGSTLDPASLSIVSPPAHASIYAVSNGTIVYASDPRFSGTDTLTYRICDVDGLCTTATASIAVS